jgi:GntR family carbon starvation induced transcriptional regulator
MASGVGEPEQWKRYDSEFHHALISNCGSQVLIETHAQFSTDISVIG